MFLIRYSSRKVAVHWLTKIKRVLGSTPLEERMNNFLDWYEDKIRCRISQLNRGDKVAAWISTSLIVLSVSKYNVSNIGRNNRK